MSEDDSSERARERTRQDTEDANTPFIAYYCCQLGFIQDDLNVVAAVGLSLTSDPDHVHAVSTGALEERDNDRGTHVGDP